MEQNFDSKAQPNLPQIPKIPNEFPIWAVIVLSVVVTALVVGIATYFLTKNNQQVVNITSTPTPTDNQTTPTNISELNSNQPVVIKSDSYAYGNKILSYAKNSQLQYSDQYVTVYFSDGGTKTEIIHQVPIGTAGGNIPEFKRTSNSSIALLATTDADMGWTYSENYYINLIAKKVVKIRTTSSPDVEITDTNNQVSKIQLSIIDNCGQGENRREDMNATLKDFAVNGKLQNVITQTRSLKCVNPGGIGGIYSPVPKIGFSGISNDLSKIFFSVEGNSWENDSKTIMWKNNFSFDLNSKVIKEENPVNIL